LNHAFTSAQDVVELFRRVLTAEGPKAGTHSARHDDGVKRGVTHKLGALLESKDTDFFKISAFGKVAFWSKGIIF
jgi:hypothetical protein